MSVVEISESKTSDDLWDLMIEEENIQNIFFFDNDHKYDFRLLGPFFRAERLFISSEWNLYNILK
jgi:hypothetical protein